MAEQHDVQVLEFEAKAVGLATAFVARFSSEERYRGRLAKVTQSQRLTCATPTPSGLHRERVYEMKLAMIGLGRMGANLTRRLMRGDHDCVVYDLDRDAVAQLEHEGAIGAATLDDLVGKLPSPRVVWIMVPAAFTDSVIDELADVLGEGDIVIDGRNGYYRPDYGSPDRP